MSKVNIFGNEFTKRAKCGHYVIKDWNKIPDAFYKDIHVPIITQDIIQSGYTHIYFRLQSGKFSPLPSRSYAIRHFTASIDALLRLNTVRIIWTNKESHSKSIPPELTIAVITLPQEIQQKQLLVNYKDYEEVCSAFDIIPEA